MEKLHVDILRQNRVRLAKDLDLDELLQVLVQNKIITVLCVEKVLSEPTFFQKKVKFLNLLPTRGPHAFTEFCSALVETDQTHLANILNQGQSSSDNPRCSFSSSFLLPTIPRKRTANSLSPPIIPCNNHVVSSPQKATEAPNRAANIPAESEDCTLPYENETKPKRLFDPHCNLENLCSSKTLEDLYSLAGILSSPLCNHAATQTTNHTMYNTQENNHNELLPAHSNQDVNESPMQLLCDSPTSDSVIVKPCTPEFFSNHYMDCYPMFKGAKGLALIINVIDFEGSACLDKRTGSEKDSARMELLLKQLAYEVYQLDNGNAKEIWKTLKNFAAWSKHKKYESCFVVLMSHGDSGIIYGRDGIAVKLDDIFALFSNANCPLLQNKPKVFLVQACRGEDPDQGVDEADGPASEEPPRNINCANNSSSITKNKLPNMSDFLIAYSTMPGYTAMRNEEDGSWFLKAFTQIAAYHAKNKSLLEIMTLTNNQIKRREGWCPSSEFHRCKEMSVFESCLCKPLYFFPKLNILP